MKSKIFYGEHNVTSPYGWRYLEGTPDFHDGVDFNLVYEPVLASRDSKVLQAAVDKYGGKYVLLQHLGLASGEWTLHHSQLLVRAGDIVKGGQEIAISGTTGLSTGPHVHYAALLNANDWNSHTDPFKFISYDEMVSTGRFKVTTTTYIITRTGSSLSFPTQFNAQPGAVFDLISPERNVDGFIWMNARFANGETCWIPTQGGWVTATSDPTTNADASKPSVPIPPSNDWEAKYRENQAEVDRLKSELQGYKVTNVQSLKVDVSGNKIVGVGLQ